MRRRVTTIFLLMLLLAGCTPAVAAAEVKSDKPRVTSPAASQSDLAGLVQGNATFALSLYQALKSVDGNLFYSPYSISAAMAMVYGGARGETEKEIASALRFTLPQAQLHPAFNSLDQELAKRGQGARGQDEKGFRLRIVNAIWGQKGFTFTPAYLDLLAQNYGAGLRIVDFVKATEPSRATINQWVSDQTEGKIKDLIPQGSVNAMTRLVLTNAVYFNAAWQYPFPKEATSNGVFRLLNGREVSVPMMRRTASLGYANGDGYQAVELPYDGRELSMVILMPEQFGAFEGSLDGRRVAAIVEEIKVRQVALTLPKFKFESSLGLKNALAGLGIREAFTDRADFAGMDGKKDLFIQDVLHKAFVAVDEAGTEAAAASGVIVGVTSALPDPVQVTIDRPFVFLIRDIKTGTLLFLGRVTTP
ncbi:MAG: serpin family protein [Chloroflexi bacterium]|nr:serpin family protein [Chloroflexota bacterium]